MADMFCFECGGKLIMELNESVVSMDLAKVSDTNVLSNARCPKCKEGILDKAKYYLETLALS